MFGSLGLTFHLKSLQVFWILKCLFHVVEWVQWSVIFWSVRCRALLSHCVGYCCSCWTIQLHEAKLEFAFSHLLRHIVTSIWTVIEIGRFVVLSALLLQIQVFSDIMLCQLVYYDWNFGEMLSLIEGSGRLKQVDCFIMKMMAPWSFRILVPIYQLTGHYHPRRLEWHSASFLVLKAFKAGHYCCTSSPISHSCPASCI